MKTKVIILVVTLCTNFALKNFAQTWTGGGSYMYYTGGNIGISTPATPTTFTPAAALDIYDNVLSGSAALNGSIFNLAQIWNTTANTTAIKLNVTNTASGASSQLMDLKVGGTSMFSVNKNGGISASSLVANSIYATTLASSSTSANANFETFSSVVGVNSTGISLAGSSNVSSRVRIGGISNSPISANYSMASLFVNSNPVTIGTTGTHPIFANLAIKKLNITAGAATLSNSASLYIEDAATGANHNYAFWSASGINRFDGSVGIATVTPNSNAQLDVNGNIYCNNKIFIGIADVNTSTVISDYALAVNGNAIFNKAKVKLYANWPDYVFSPEYKLTPLKEVESYLFKNNHLPDVKTAAEIEKNGIDLGETQTILLKKIEELTLYMIDLNKKVEQLTIENNSLRNKVEKMNNSNN